MVVKEPLIWFKTTLKETTGFMAGYNPQREKVQPALMLKWLASKQSQEIQPKNYY